MKINNYKVLFLAATSAVALTFMTTGCDRTISKTEDTKVSSDGAVKTKEKTVTEKPDGSIQKTEETKKTSP